MDLKTIDHNIRSEKYMTEGALLEDMKLMFRNARHYNEEGSQVSTQVLLEPMESSSSKERCATDQGAGEPAAVPLADALCRLQDLMLLDTLNIRQTYNL
nr:protein polybromo-1-like [Salvelinus alpinus]